jgi:dolichyl-phosphate beta-glucosyltransferase
MISVIVPAYNESGRIGPFLTGLVELVKKEGYELLVIDDGSTDGTATVSSELISSAPNARVISYSPNRGKGHAVKTGVLASKGDPIIFIDADGSIPPEEIPKMVEELKKYDVVVGDRSSAQSVITQPKLRKFLGVIFNKYVDALFRVQITDFLCGFKGFRREAAKELFEGLVSDRWIFDVELFYKAKKNGYLLYKMPIRWVHKEQSKIKPLDPVKMFGQALSLRLKV